MFDLEREIREWRRGFGKYETFEDGLIADMEMHLREAYADLSAPGVSGREAFRLAVGQVGTAERIAAEYRKNRELALDRRTPWRPGRFMPALLWNYTKVATRAVHREKVYTAINIAGLSIGLACFMLIGLWVKSELSFDRFHENKERIFRVLNQTRDGRFFATPTYALAPELKNSFPEVEEFSRVWSWQASLVTRGEHRFQENRIGLADPGFFRMFSFPFIEGNAAAALRTKNSIVLTASTARKYFGHGRAVGGTLFLEQYQADFTVSGVIRDIPANSHIQFDLLARVELLGEDRLARWQEWTGPCYIMLRSGVSAAAFDGRIRGIYKKHIAANVDYAPVLQALTQVNLQQSGRPDNGIRVFLFSLIAVFILLLACINFINLLTARSFRRAREIGLRKVVGASRLQIVWQFLGETLLTAAVSMALALLWVQLMLPGFNRFSGKSLALFRAVNLEMVLPLALLIVTTGLLAGIYPALLLSRFQPAQVLRPPSFPGGRGGRLRTILMVFQFAVSGLLLTFTLAVGRQLTLIDTIDLGLERDNIVGIMNNPVLAGHFSTFKDELLKEEGIVSVTAGAKAPTMVGESFLFGWRNKQGAKTLVTDYTVADYDYLKTFAMRIVAGRDFSERYPADENESCIVNEAAVRQMDVQDPIGMGLYLDHPAWPEDFRKVRVIGVVRDFHSRTLHAAIRPFIFRIYRPWHTLVFVKIDGQKTAVAMRAIEKTFKRLVPGHPFEYQFYEDAYLGQYASERMLGRLLQAFTMLSLFIACLGLLGLTAYTVEQKAREIGIRRVFGASIPGLAWTNVVNFIKWVALAHLIAWPLAFILIRRWLSEFAYPIGIGPGLFVQSALLTLAVTLMTVGVMAVRAARANPVESLRYE